MEKRSPVAEARFEVARIWDRSPHQAFTDLIRFRNRWLCTFREGSAHVSPDGAIRVLASEDGKEWRSIAHITLPGEDLRDPKVSITPEGRLMIVAAGAIRGPEGTRHRSMVWFSGDGEKWSEPAVVADPDVWLWRAAWRHGTAYGVGYSTGKDALTRLYSSRDGKKWETRVSRLFDAGFANEASLLFGEDDRVLCLLRRDGDGASGTAQLGAARPPYRDWTWKDLGVRIGGPHLIRLPDGRIVAAVRLVDGGARTSLAWLDPDAGRLTEFLRLPSGGDSSYPGLAWHDDRLWVSYYSSHEQKTSIYLAKVTLPAR